MQERKMKNGPTLDFQLPKVLLKKTMNIKTAPKEKGVAFLVSSQVEQLNFAFKCFQPFKL